MKTRFWALLVLVSMVAVGSQGPQGAGGKEERDPGAVYLYEQTAQGVIQVNGGLHAERVYVVYRPELETWVYMKTDLEGKFPSPPEVIGTGTVLPGAAVGAHVPGRHYRLTSQGTWVPTRDEEKLSLLVLGKEPTVRTIARHPMGAFKLKAVGDSKPIP